MGGRKQSAGEGLPFRAESGTDSRAERSRAEGVYTDMSEKRRAEGVHTDMSEKVLRVQMFGGFAMYYGDEAVTLNKAGSSKSVRLLQMLLLSLPGGIAKNELIDNLYGWNEKGDVANRNKNLNNLIYRLKGQLVSGGLPDDEYVELNDGMCFFKSRIPLELDTQKFEETVELAKIAWGGGEKGISFLVRPMRCTAESFFRQTSQICGFIRKATTIKSCISGRFGNLNQSI